MSILEAPTKQRSTPISVGSAAPAAKRKFFTPLRISIAAGVVIGVAGLLMLAVGGSSDPVETRVLTYNVAPVSFDVRIKLAGELKAQKNVEIRNQVEGVTTILWLVPEGTVVKTGDVLVKLASDAIRDRVEDARIRVENAKAAAINAQETVTIQINQNESDLKTAEMNAELSAMEYDQFDKGDAVIELKNRQTAFANAETDLKRKTMDLERVTKLAENKFVSDNDVLDAQIALREAQNKLEVAKMDLERWNSYAEPRQRQTLERKRDEAGRELERTKRKTAANLLLREADRRAKESTLRVEAQRLAGLEEQLLATEIRAPQPGMVVYQSSIANNQSPIEEGAQVRQNQILIQLPDTGRMLAEVRIAEQLTDRVATGQPVVVTVDAVPGKVLSGRIDRISPLPDSSNRWMNPNLKEYPTQVTLDDTPKGLKPGMSVRAEIEVAHLDSVTAVPMQAVFNGGGQTYVYVGSAEQYEKRVVKVGLSSSEYTEIKEGLQPGEVVLLSRPKGAPEDLPPPSNTPRDKGKKNGKPANAEASKQEKKQA